MTALHGQLPCRYGCALLTIFQPVALILSLRLTFHCSNAAGDYSLLAFDKSWA